MSAPDFERMTKDEVIAWFKDTNDLSPILTAMTPAYEPATRPADTPMMLASIRLPVELVEQLDNLAALHGMRRSDRSTDTLARSRGPGVRSLWTARAVGGGASRRPSRWRPTRSPARTWVPPRTQPPVTVGSSFQAVMASPSLTQRIETAPTAGYCRLQKMPLPLELPPQMRLVMVGSGAVGGGGGGGGGGWEWSCHHHQRRHHHRRPSRRPGATTAGPASHPPPEPPPPPPEPPRGTRRPPPGAPARRARTREGPRMTAPAWRAACR